MVEKPQSHMLDLLDVNLGETSPVAAVDPWGLPQAPPHTLAQVLFSINQIELV